MNTDIGANIKFFRTQRGITQRELAEVMKVSHQAVSRWENCVRLPDVDALPRLAQFFDINIDDLFYDRRTSMQKYEQSVREQFDSFIINNQYDRARDLIENAHKKMPDSFYITSKYVYLVSLDKDPSDAERLEMLSNRIYNNCSDKQTVYDTVYAMVKFYAGIGKYYTAMNLAESQPTFWAAKETLRCLAADNEQTAFYAACALYESLNVMQTMCAHHYRVYPPQKSIDSYKRYIGVLDGCLNDYDSLEFDAFYCSSYAHICACYARLGEYNSAFENLETACKYYIEYFSRPRHAFNDNWFKGLDFETGKNNNMYHHFFRDLFDHPDFERLRNDERFEPLLTAAESSAENYKI